MKIHTTNIKLVTCSLLITIFGNCFVISTLFAQNKIYIIEKEIFSGEEAFEKENFNLRLMQLVLLDEINRIRIKYASDSIEMNPMLEKPALHHAAYMAANDYSGLEEGIRKLRTTENRLKNFGLAPNGMEITAKTATRSGQETFSYNKLAQDIVFKWYASRKSYEILTSISFPMLGIGAALDETGKKIYLSAIFGNYTTFNTGLELSANLKASLPEKISGIKPYNEKNCKRITKIQDLSAWQKMLYIEENQVFLKSENRKELKKVLKSNQDGLAVEFVQKSQFMCGYENIVNHNLPIKGILSKKIKTKNIFSNTNATVPGSELLVKLADLPDNLNEEDVELNMVLILDKCLCASVPQSFTIASGNIGYQTHTGLLADTITMYNTFTYKPIADTSALSFIIPFDKKKYTYKTEDIEPFLKLLNEPDFIINELKISAFTSIEGADKENLGLQRKRAQSIVNALKMRQHDSIKTSIETGYAWEQFKTDIRGTQHNILASMSLEEAQLYIQKYELQKKLEPILKNHRFAKIDLNVTYDISGNKETAFVLNKFNKAVALKNLPEALAIQKYILKKLTSKKYDPNVLKQMKIPDEQAFAGMAMNNIWANIFIDGQNPINYVEKIQSLSRLDPKNEYLKFNSLLCQVEYMALTNERSLTVIQNEIDKLYLSAFPKATIDGLNMKLQFKIIRQADSIQTSDRGLMVQKCLDRIKKIVEIEEESMSNSFKLANLFILQGDNDFALQLLSPFIVRSDASEDVLFTWLSLCSSRPALMQSLRFSRAMQQARQLNHKRFCELFDGRHFSLQILENVKVKTEFCKYCQSTNNE